jgi:hypothetical protein
MASEGTHAFQVHNMVAAPKAVVGHVQIMFKSEDGIMLCYGTAADTVLEAEAANTYAPGCMYIKVVAGGTSIVYVNTGAADAVATFTSIM